MKLNIDRDNNVAYLYLDEKKANVEGIVGQSLTLITFDEDGMVDQDMGIIVDFDRDGGVVGFEFLNARTQLAEVWDRAIDPLSA